MPNFINPYNFIPMGKTKGSLKKDEGEKTYTGVIEYSVLTKSPLFIPNTSNEKTFEQSYLFDEEQEKKREEQKKKNEQESDGKKKKDNLIHKSYDFYSYHDLSDYKDKSSSKVLEKRHFRPVIPGSEIRGMFRSNFEILTNSCMSALDTDEQLSKRTMERFKAGLLKKNGGKFELYRATDIAWKKQYGSCSYKEGSHVSFTEVTERWALAQNVFEYDRPRGNRVDGYIIKGGQVEKKYWCHIFYSPSGQPISVTDKALRQYENNIKCKEQWQNFKNGSGDGYFPVYYSQIRDENKKTILKILTGQYVAKQDIDEQTKDEFLPGLLKKNGEKIDLYKAKKVLWKCSYNQGQAFQEGSHVNFEEDWVERILADNVHEYDRGKGGYLIKGEKGPTKRWCHVFHSPSGRPFTVPLKDNKLDKILAEYENNGENTYEEYKEQWEDFKKGTGNEYFPVYYSLINSNGEKLLFLSPACITREIYDNTLADFAGNLKPCDELKKLCPACSLFGTVMEDGAWASRIRFSDLEGEEREDYKSCYEPLVTLPPLSSPKLNNMEFYLKRPNNAWFWTYDYYIDANGNLKLQRGELAGRKFYWHNAKSLEKLKEEWAFSGKADQLNMTVRPLKKGYTFKGKLYFKMLTQTELDLLIYLLNAGDECDEITEKQHGYKLGAAKPLGFGSIACHADRLTLISYALEGNTVVKKVDEKKNPAIAKCPITEEVVINFEKMTNFDTASKEGKICYPRKEGQDGGEGFAWFVANHGGYNRNYHTYQPMPSNRQNMIFNEYMEAMAPQLVSTGVGADA